MSEKNSFRESLRVESETMAKLNNVSKNYSSKKSLTSQTESSGGRERGDEGPGRLGREHGYKSGNNPRATAVKNASLKANTVNSNGRTVAVKDSISSAHSSEISSSIAGRSNSAGQSGAALSSGKGSSGHGQGK